ncbi:MAG TPA: collagen-like protein [Candidatus Intestinimonas stercorigallinarum]|nr:collagen-like protein [Candidatus Intestinimonas stercorigallinarum]
MRIYLQDGTELEPLDISGEPATVQGEARDSLVIAFPASAGLEAINTAFSAANCESIRIVEDGGTEHIHTGYVLRVSLVLAPGEDESGDGRIAVTMAKRNYAEEQLLAIRTMAEETAAQMTDTQLALPDVSVGPPGPQGETGPQGPQGPAGADGYTPERGVDYWTEADRQQMVQDVIDALPVYNGEVESVG